jgi:hypothetical protein
MAFRPQVLAEDGVESSFLAGSSKARRDEREPRCEVYIYHTMPRMLKAKRDVAAERAPPGRCCSRVNGNWQLLRRRQRAAQRSDGGIWV